MGDAKNISDFELWSILVRVFIAVNRQHGHGSSSKETVNWGGLLAVSEVQFIIVMTRFMAV